MTGLCFYNRKKIILARHGETYSNRAVRIMGRTDSPLTPEALIVADQLAGVITKENPEAVYCSPLGRAVSSAAIYTKGLHIPIFIRDTLAELSCGEWEGRALEEVNPGSRRLRSSWEERPPGGESYQDAEPRATAIIEEICSADSLKTALVVSHAGFNRVLLKLLLQMKPEHAILILPRHDAVFILDHVQGVTSKSSTGQETHGLLFLSE
jgi:broad specificity phosphatase PhoE